MIQRFIVGVSVASAISFACYVFTLSAMRPFTPFLASIRVTVPEAYLAALVALSIFVIVLLRLLRGSKVKDEMERVLNLEGD